MGKRFGPFEVGEELGRGAWGVVYRAAEAGTGREVALKLLLAPGATEKRLKRFEREAQVAAALNHPGIVPVEGSGREGSQPWIAFTFVRSGRTLDEVFAVAPFEDRIRMVRDVARAIGYAHERGVVHRDLKTANVLVEGDGQVRVTDFGLAAMRGVERLTATGDLLGTPLAMAPEQIGGERESIGPATDVWAIGVLLYRAISGRDPFEATTFVELGSQICSQSPPPLKAAREEESLPPGLAAVCLRCLAKAPAGRYADGAAVAHALDALDEQPPTQQGGRGRWVLALGVVITLLIAAILIGTRSGPQPTTQASATATPTPVQPPSVQPTASTSELSAEERAQVEAADRILAELSLLPPRSAKAQGLAERAVEAAPFYGRARFFRGVVRLTLQEYDAGQADLEQAETAAIPFREIELYEKRGAMYSFLKRYDQAVADLERVYTPSSNSKGALKIAAMYGMSLRLAQRHERAAEVLGRLWREHRPTDWRIPYHLAASLQALRRRDEVYPLLKAAFDLAPRQAPFPRLRLFSICVDRYRTAEAAALEGQVLATLGQAVEAAEVHYLIGRLRTQQGRRAEAVQAYRRSIALARSAARGKWAARSKRELEALGVR